MREIVRAVAGLLAAAGLVWAGRNWARARALKTALFIAAVLVGFPAVNALYIDLKLAVRCLIGVETSLKRPIRAL